MSTNIVFITKVEQFKYLGLEISSRGGCKLAIKAGTASALNKQ